MYKKACQFSVSPLDIWVNDRILGVKTDRNDALPIYAFSVYIPSVKTLKNASLFWIIFMIRTLHMDLFFSLVTLNAIYI